MSKEMGILMAAFADAKEHIRQIMWVIVILFVPAIIIGLIPWVIAILLK